MTPRILPALTVERPGRALHRVEDYFAGSFQAMANPCTVLVDTDDETEAEELLGIAEAEARRVEEKFSRYRCGNVVDRINHSDGGPIDLDEETAQLINYAVTCLTMSDGMFDITSGVLRRVWTFDGGSKVPSREAIRKCLQHVGCQRVRW